VALQGIRSGANLSMRVLRTRRAVRLNKAQTKATHELALRQTHTNTNPAAAPHYYFFGFGG
jgi:hypothetical protein